VTLDPLELRDFCLELADLADAETLPAFQEGLEVDTKADGTPVTAADRRAERAVRAAIRARYPHHAVLGEEDGLDGPQDAPTWIVDPIDGTRSFINGNPVYATLIAVRIDGQEVACSVSAPAMGMRWDGVAGGPARRNGRPVRVSRVAELSHAQVSFGDLSSFAQSGRGEALGRLIEATLRQRGYGDFWSFCHVAQGTMDVAAEAIASIWDFSAVKCLVEAAGGRFTSFEGAAAADQGSGLATNGLLHDATLALVSVAPGGYRRDSRDG
jgi:histidinol-phosphatase